MSTLEAFGAGVRAARENTRAKRERRSGTRTRGRVYTAVAEHGLSVVGFACFTAAAVLVAIPLGLAVAGVSCLLLEWRLSA